MAKIAQGGLSMLSTGYIDLSVRERNEAESVIVKPGCKFIGKKNCHILFIVGIVNRIAYSL